MNFEGWMKFSKQFALFPSFLSQEKLKQMFYGLASLFPLVSGKKKVHTPVKAWGSNTQREDEPVDRRDIIDQNLFIEAIAMSAIEVEGDSDKHAVEKVNQDRRKGFNHIIDFVIVWKTDWSDWT